jgi:hypothetical protein
MSRRTVISLLVTVALLGVGAFPALAAPDNKNTGGIEDVECASPLGTIDITFVEHNSSVTAFGPDGQPLVIKHFAGMGTITITVEDGPTLSFPDAFEEVVPGEGFQDRLVECTGTFTFEETFTIRKREAGFLMLGNEFIGSTATVTGVIDFTAMVIVPGA